MNREMIESFVAIVNHNTASAAAKSLFVAQSTISHRIQLLEQELGITLFERERGFKQMKLSENGKQFYPLAVQWLELNRQMMQLKSSQTLGLLKIGSMDSINQFLLPRVIHEIHSELPEIQMEFVSYHSQEIYSRLTSSQLDIGFAFYPISYNDIKATPVFREPMYMVCLPGSRYPDGDIVTDSLKKRDEVYFAWDEGVARWNSEHWSEKEPPFVTVDSCALITTFLTAPGLWTVCPASVATNFHAMYGLEIHKFIDPPPDRVCYMLLQNSPHSSAAAGRPALDLFVSAFNRLLMNHPWRY